MCLNDCICVLIYYLVGWFVLFFYLQRLQDFDKAYGDMILNTSNEADAKVMAAEKKAQSLEQELQVTKAEAVQKMAMLKKMMDDKV